MDWRRKGRLVVTVHTASVPSDADWAEYIAGARDYTPVEDQRIFVVSAGGGPNGRQRKILTDSLAGALVPVSIVTDSMLMRGAGIAVAWFNPSLRIFGPDALEPAFEHLQLTNWERADCRQTVHELQWHLKVNVTRSNAV
jgi:hypothetical protein